MLQIANAAMDHLETFSRRGAAKVVALDQCRAQSAHRSITSCACAERTRTDDQNVVLSVVELVEIASHIYVERTRAPERCMFDADRKLSPNACR